MTLTFESSKFKKLKEEDNETYFVEGYKVPPVIWERFYNIGKKLVEEADPMTILAKEAKLLAKEARTALFPGMDEDEIEAMKVKEGNLFAEDDDDTIDRSEEIQAPEVLTKTKINEELFKVKPKAKPKVSLKDSGVEAKDLTTPQIVEAVMLCSRTPMTAKKIALAIKGITETEIIEAIAELNEFYLENKRSFRVQEIGGGYQIRTDSIFEPWLREVYVKQKVETLTPASTETMAIIAYKQPITKVEVDNIRGVDCGGHIRNLMEKDLVQINGKSPEIGNPNLYGTTKKFLETYGLNEIDDLPSIEDIKDIV
ncbi:MAG: SMC-Scp complex subunit ScpB [Planctomycetota bacterium]|nr:MAG: SMC-Scp complex subunit ScpB [Planctomycetota bacterium]